MAGRRFHSLCDLREQFERWRDEIAHRRPCPGDNSLTVAQALEKERATLLPLPENPASTDDVRAVINRKRPYVRYDTNRYSIPHQLVGRPLTLVAGAERIRVLDGDKLVAEHVRSWDRNCVVEDKAHIAALLEHKRHGRISGSRTRLLAHVPQLEELYVELVRRGEPLSSNTTRFVQLLDQHGAHLLADAVARALERGTPRATSVEHLINQSRRQTGTPPPVLLHLPNRSDVRDLETKNHDLEGYDDLA